MEFKFTTEYNKSSVTVLTRALRKTVRKKRSMRSIILTAVLIVFVALTLIFPNEDGVHLDMPAVLSVIVCIALVFVLIFQDKINASISIRAAIPGVEKTVVTFLEDEYYTETAVGNTSWTYGKITALAETDGYFVFIIGNNHGQVYDKSSLEGGTVDEFRTFIEEKMGMKSVKI